MTKFFKSILAAGTLSLFLIFSFGATDALAGKGDRYYCANKAGGGYLVFYFPCVDSGSSWNIWSRHCYQFAPAWVYIDSPSGSCSFKWLGVEKPDRPVKPTLPRRDLKPNLDPTDRLPQPIGIAPVRNPVRGIR